MSILRKEAHRVDHDLLWASIGHPLDVFSIFPPKGDDLPANEMLSNGSNHTISWKGEALPWCTGDTKAIKNFCDLRFYHAHSHERLEIWSHPQPWDALGWLWKSWDMVRQPMPFGDAGPLQQLRPGIAAAGYQFLRISGFCWCFKVQLWFPSFPSLACGSVVCCPSFFLGDLPSLHGPRWRAPGSGWQPSGRFELPVPLGCPAADVKLTCPRIGWKEIWRTSLYLLNLLREPNFSVAFSVN